MMSNRITLSASYVDGVLKAQCNRKEHTSLYEDTYCMYASNKTLYSGNLGFW